MKTKLNQFLVYDNSHQLSESTLTTNTTEEYLINILNKPCYPELP